MFEIKIESKDFCKNCKFSAEDNLGKSNLLQQDWLRRGIGL